MDSFLFVDKPSGISSAGLVNRVKWLLSTSKVGHCGTLDPLANGLLILCFGRATKIARFILGADKTYEATITFGARSETYDADGPLTEVSVSSIPSREQVTDAMMEFTGKLQQRPPAYSAIKVAGKRLYDYARKQKAVEAKEREVQVARFDLLEYDYPHLKARIVCSTGTYVRSLANDLGERLGCGGYISALRRTAIGSHSVADAIAMSELEQAALTKTLVANASYQRAYRSVESMLELPEMNLSAEREAIVVQGVPIRGDDVVRCAAGVQAHDLVAIKSREGQLLAVGRALCAAEQMPGMDGKAVFEYVRVM